MINHIMLEVTDEYRGFRFFYADSPLRKRGQVRKRGQAPPSPWGQVPPSLGTSGVACWSDMWYYDINVPGDECGRRRSLRR